MITPRKLPEPSPEDDPTGVRALLSSMPEPDPMPVYLVERISASLAAEQARRAGPDRHVTALRTTGAQRGRTWGARLAKVLAGAAAVAVIGLVGSNLLGRQLSGSSDSAATSAAFSSAGPPGSAGAESGLDLDAAGGNSGATPADTGALLDVRVSSTRYTSATLAAQAKALLAAPTGLQAMGGGHVPTASSTASSTTGSKAATDAKASLAGAGMLGTDAGMWACLKSIGVSLRPGESAIADLATYDGSPAAVVVTTQGGAHVAYVVRRDCSATNAALVTAVPLH